MGDGKKAAKAGGAPGRKKIAIVGGGPAGLSTAYHLTRDPAWREKYEITVYQLGWRVGGKGATGRDAANHQRIEEHGIHGFCNFYFNTFSMLRDIYANLDASDRERLPTKQMSTAFRGSSRTYAIAATPLVWSGVLDWLPSTEGDPWDGWQPDLSWKKVVAGVLIQLAWRGRSDEQHPIVDASDLLRSDYEPQVEAAANALHGTIWRIWQEQADVPADLPSDMLDTRLRAWIADLDAQRSAFFVLANAAAGKAFPPASPPQVAPPVRAPNLTALRALSVLDLYWTVLRGVVADRLLLPDADLDQIDAIDYRDWLVSHGLSELVKSSPILSSVANILFAYPQGDTSARPQLSAASWVTWMLRSVIGHGAYFYFMAAGTGESVILPLYLSLARAGVRFEFFHKLVGAKSSAGANPRITELHFRRQARTKGDRPYEPLVQVRPEGKEPFWAWPNKPNYAQLREASALRDADLEAWESQPRERARKLLLRKDFDEVVWAVPPTITQLVGDAGMKKKWAFLSQLGTTATQGAQVWLTKSTKTLGWNPLANATAPTVRPSERYACSSYPQPLNAFVVFDDLIEYEAWPANASPQGLIYLCAQLQELDQPASERSRKRDEVRALAATSSALRLLGKFLPGASIGPSDPYSLRFDLIHVPGAASATAHGEERLRAQYYRANTRPTEAYVQANPGTAAARRFAWDSGFANAVLAGDWTYTGMNMGAFESAITGGKLAAFALVGNAAQLDEIHGFTFLRASARAQAEAALASGVVPRLR
jgi:uncharacterized protein with NAD-binding domain and iron-sulfur cluster